MKRTDNYAGNQIRLFLGELKNATHVAKVKSIQHFQTYIKTYQPNVRKRSPLFSCAAPNLSLI